MSPVSDVMKNMAIQFLLYLAIVFLSEKRELLQHSKALQVTIFEVALKQGGARRSFRGLVLIRRVLK